MIVVVSYDLSDEKRRRRLASALLNFGSRVQYSVFECHLDERQMEAMQAQVDAVLDPSEDRLIYVGLCAKDKDGVLCDGPKKLTRDWDYWIL